MILSACSEPLEFADWTIPVPEGTRIVEYAHVADEERTETFELERDLVLTEAFGRPLYRPAGVEVASDGSIFVLDAGNHRVVVFAAEGGPLVEFGREGQGPGEFQGPEDLALVADTVVVMDGTNSRFSVFRVEGTHIVDHRLEERIRTSQMRGFGNDLLMIRYTLADTGPSGESLPGEWSAGRYSLSGQELDRITELPYIDRAHWRHGVWTGSGQMRPYYTAGVIGLDGSIYATNGDEYQVLALDPSGVARWALRVNYRPPALAEERKREVVTQTIEDWSGILPELSADDFVWPERHAAIDGLMVDGHGNLYVFPLFYRWVSPGPLPEGPFPVDVYSPGGERVFSGTVAIWGWNASHNNHIYRIETDPDTGEQVVARYRFMEPLE
jgi:outer membrane protein assembly factor BamB